MKITLRNQPGFKKILLLLDVAVFLIATVIALSIVSFKGHISADSRTTFYFYAITVSGVGLVIYIATLYLNNLYKRHIILTNHRQFVLLVKTLLITCALVLLLAVFFFHVELATFGRLFFALLFFICLILSVIFRIFLLRPLIKTAAKSNFSSRNLVLVGKKDVCIKVIRLLAQDPFNHFRIIGLIDETLEAGAEVPYGQELHEHTHNLGSIDNLPQVIRMHDVQEVLIAADDIAYNELIYLVEHCVRNCPVVRVYSDFLRVIADKMQVELYSGIPVIMLSCGRLDHPVWKIKRYVDIVISLLALIILSPVFAGIALGIKLSSRGPVFFKQIRIGKEGQPFNFYKFRSMHVGNDSNNHKQFVQDFIKKDDNCADDTIKVFKITDDPRIFPFGSFIRKTSLDEFPQFYNVLKGDMSLVGPRPCLPYEWECYDEWHKNRLDVLPGCTGMWQALGRSTVSFEEMVVLDLYYINNMSMWLDIRTVLQTFPVIFLGKGGY